MPDDNAVYLKPPVTSIAEAIERLEEIGRHIEENEPRERADGLGCFNHLYTVITKRVDQGVDGAVFADKVFLTELDIAFANRYIDALRVNVDRSKEVPRSWHVLLERRTNPRIESIQFAVAGVNAHINFDLALALIETCETLGTDLDTGSQRADYLKVNEIFSQEMQSLRQHYLDEVALVIDTAASPVLNVVGDWSVEAARDAAWEVAEQLWLIKSFGIDERPLARRLDRLVALSGHLLLTPFT